MTSSSLKIHEGVSADHYDLAIKTNILQRYWHFRRFHEVLKLVTVIDGRIVDIGCHSGLFTQKIALTSQTQQVYGIDLSSCAIDKAKKRIKNGRFFVGDAQKLPFKSNYFDAAFCLEMLEHVDYPDRVLSEIHRVTKKDGYVIVLIPTDNMLFRVIWFLWNLRYPVWKHVHVQSFRRDILEKMAQQAGFRIQTVKTFNLKMLKIVKLIKP